MKLYDFVMIASAVATSTFPACSPAVTSANAAPDTDEALYYCHGKVQSALAAMRQIDGGDSIDFSMMPRNIEGTATQWHRRHVDNTEWCSGFYPGILWYDFEASGDSAVGTEAIRATEAMVRIASDPVYDHDLGFLIFCAMGNAYNITGSDRYRRLIIQTADSLATLYNPNVGTILSWPRNVAMFGGHNTIMDNMINLDMLFWAAEHGGADSLRTIAISHADKTMRCHFRPDYTCYHVAVYNPENGDFIKGVTHQGYADSSTWARGQAWAIYGFTDVYRHTKDPKYLDFACKVADAYLSRLPQDRIPYWDFDAPVTEATPRDASAAAVTASALLLLQQYCSGDTQQHYLSEAKHMLASLQSENYKSAPERVSFLDHSTGHHPGGSEIDAAIVYADYYYIEALLRLRKIEQGENLFAAL